MFLVKGSSQQREQRIQAFSQEDPSLSALLAVIHFEWTVRRAILALGTSPNVDVREKLTYCHGCHRLFRSKYANVCHEHFGWLEVPSQLENVLNDLVISIQNPEEPSLPSIAIIRSAWA
jgi:hypothetical protein